LCALTLISVVATSSRGCS